MVAFSLYSPTRHLLNTAAPGQQQNLLPSLCPSVLQTGFFPPLLSFNFKFHALNIVLGEEGITTVQILLSGGLPDRLCSRFLASLYHLAVRDSMLLTQTHKELPDQPPICPPSLISCDQPSSQQTLSTFSTPDTSTGIWDTS